MPFFYCLGGRNQRRLYRFQYIDSGNFKMSYYFSELSLISNTGFVLFKLTHGCGAMSYQSLN